MPILIEKPSTPWLHLKCHHRMLLSLAIAAVWIFHGLYSKVLGGIPRHRQIVARVLGEKIAGPATVVVGLLEIALGVWVLVGTARVECAAVQTAGLVAMNTLEIWRARDLLLSAAGMGILNFAFLALVWWWALAAP